MWECKYVQNSQNSFPLFHRLENIRHGLFSPFPSWKIQQGPLNVFSPLVFFSIPLLTGYDIGSSVIQWENQSKLKRDSSKIGSVLAFTQNFHVMETSPWQAQTRVILTRNEQVFSAPVCLHGHYSWNQLFQKSYSFGNFTYKYFQFICTA